jgi:hypothetical protein
MFYMVFVTLGKPERTMTEGKYADIANFEK